MLRSNFRISKNNALALVVAFCKFRHYIHGRHMIVKLLIPAVKIILLKTYLHGKLENWLAKIQEYDLEFTIRKTINGRKISFHLAQHLEP